MRSSPTRSEQLAEALGESVDADDNLQRERELLQAKWEREERALEDQILVGDAEHQYAKIALLDKLHHGLQHGVGFIDTLLKHELLEQITLDLAFNDGSKKTLQGLYCIAEERLYQLKGDVLESLNEAGYLQPVFMAVASLSRMRDLIERRNRLRP